MAKLFDMVRGKRPKRNKFDLSHERKMSMQMGNLVPILCQDIVPGDKFRVKSEIFVRLAPMLAPIMHRVNVYTHYFFVPNRLVWSEWEDFITGGREGLTTPVAPYATTEQLRASALSIKGTIADYFGLPVYTLAEPALAEVANVSMLPFRAYQTIYNEYFRDQNVSASLDLLKTSGNVAGAELIKILTMRVRAWEHDYFTSSLPWAQRGGAVDVPLSDDTSAITQAYEAATGNPYPGGEDVVIGAPGLVVGSTSGGMHIGADGHGINVNDLRRSIRLQEWLEKNARGGARYVEQILSHFGVRSSDARLQRPEYLGGGRQPINISEVLSTFQDDAGTIPQGNMAGHGSSYGTSNGFTRSFEEHGYVIGLMSVIPRTAYQQGIPRHFSRSDKFDYYWPEFANIGEQEVAMKELYYTGVAGTTPEATFGYQSRYSEYKYGCSSVHGDFRDNLAFWHMGRQFAAQPALNETFITSSPTQRIFAVEDSTVDKLYVHMYNKVDAVRPMPYFGTPTL